MKRATEDPSTGNTANRPPHRRSGRLLFACAVAVVALLWIVYWYGASQIASAVLDRATAAAASRGYAAQCEDMASGGFPLSLDLSCRRASFTGNASGLLAILDGFSATTPLYRPGRIAWQATGPLVVDAPAAGVDLSATWQIAATELDANLDGLSAVATSIEDLRVDLPSAPDKLPFGGLTLSNADLSIIPESGGAYRLSASATAIALLADNGGNLPKIDIDANVTALDFGDTLGLDPRQSLAAWIANGGNLRIDDLTAVTEAVSTSYSGDLALSPDGTFSGSLDVVIAGIDALPELAETFRPGSRDQAAQIVAAVVAFSRPVETPSGIAREMKLLVRDSVVSIGILPIGVIPTIGF